MDAMATVQQEQQTQPVLKVKYANDQAEEEQSVQAVQQTLIVQQDKLVPVDSVKIQYQNVSGNKQQLPNLSVKAKHKHNNKPNTDVDQTTVQEQPTVPKEQQNGEIQEQAQPVPIIKYVTMEAVSTQPVTG